MSCVNCDSFPILVLMPPPDGRRWGARADGREQTTAGRRPTAAADSSPPTGDDHRPPTDSRGRAPTADGRAPTADLRHRRQTADSRRHPEQLTADFVRRFAELGDAIRIYTDGATLDDALASAARTAGPIAR